MTQPFSSHPSSRLDGFVMCHARTDWYALRGRDVRTVTRAEQLQLEANPATRIGVLREGGETWPVYALLSLLGGEADPVTADQHVVIVDGAKGPFGLLVDRAVRASTTNGSGVLPVPPLVGPACAARFEGLLLMDDRACLVLFPAGLDPLAPAPRSTGPRPAAAARRASRTTPADIVVIFSSPSLPDCGTARYALDARQFGALVQSLPAVPLPGSAPHVAALAWWRDLAVPVLDFRDARARRRDGSAPRYLVARGGSRAQGAFVAFAVEADAALHRATAEDGLVKRGAGAAFARGVFRVGDERLALLDLDALIAAAPERAAVPA